MLKELDCDVRGLSLNSNIPDDIANLILGHCFKDIDMISLIDADVKRWKPVVEISSIPQLKIVGRIDLDNISRYDSLSISSENGAKMHSKGFYAQYTPRYDRKKQSFWIDELVMLSPSYKANRIAIGLFDKKRSVPLYSVLIGPNGVGKSSVMKEIIDFFIDLHAYVNETSPKLSAADKRRLRGIRFHINGVECEVIRLEWNYFVRIDGKGCLLKDLLLPTIVACHFGAFDKFPIPKVNGSHQTRYDVPYYKYVGAHVNVNMISSSAIIFRLLFALDDNMDERQQQNICSILDFIGYDHKISLKYSFVIKSRKDTFVRDALLQRVQKDREYLKCPDKKEKANQLYEFYKQRTSMGKAYHYYEIDIDNSSKGSDKELQYIYKLKQYEFVDSTNVIFHKQNSEITSEEMSSGEFAMLSTVLSISAAANDPHTLVLLDEPELSLHPNWQMTLIDNLDRALKNQVCHLLIGTHSHMLVSDLPMNRSFVTQLEKDEEGNLKSTSISESTYGWSAEEVLFKVFKTATDRNRFFAERVGKLLKQIGDNTISPEDVADELKELQEISEHLSDIDPMKRILNTIVETYNTSK